MTTFSIIISNYNYCIYLEECIESVLQQSYVEFNLIIVDDCSTDGSRNLINQYKKNNKVTIVLHPLNKGQGGCFNSGFSHVTGDVVLFLDADDYLLPGALTALNDHYDVSISQYQYYMQLVDASGKKYDTFPQPEVGMDSGDLSSAVLKTASYKTTVNSGLAFSKTTLNQVLPVDEDAFNMGTDGYLMMVAPLYGNVYTINIELAAYRQHQISHAKFNNALLKRAYWCLQHNAYRYNALREHANKLGLSVTEPLGYADLFNLEQSMVVLLLAKEKVLESKLERNTISQYALTLIKQDTPGIRKRVLIIWWYALGYLPRPLATTLVRWKLDSKSRPDIIKRIAKFVRSH